MPNSQLNPGETVRVAGPYILVNRNGKSMDVAIRREIGERLPLAVAADGPLWYVLVASTTTAQAA